MAARLSGTDLQSHLNILIASGVVGHLTDGQILRRFLSDDHSDAGAAFTALVDRHGPMVLGVCREVLGDSHDADDAFQAAFLVLFRRAGSVRDADSVASWLHGVALRVARRARSDAVRRKAVERRGAEQRALRNARAADRPESWTELHEEIARLPQRFREPLVLCYLEGLPTEAVAQRLGCPKGTVLSRLSRGRERLRDRLTRRGLAPTASLVAHSRLLDNAPVRVPEPLLNATIQITTGQIALVPATIAALTERILRAMLWTKLMTGALAGVALAALILSARAALAYQDTKRAGQAAALQKALKEPVTPVARPAEPAKFPDSSGTVIVSLPARAELHQLLRRASSEAIVVAKTKPESLSWTLTTIAAAQARAGDAEGASATFADAVKEAAGDFGGPVSPWNLWRIGHVQAGCGQKDEARATLQAAVKALPGLVGDFQDDIRTIDTFAVIVQDRAQIGARVDAHKTVELLLVFTKKFFESSKIGNARDVAAPKIASALAAVGDFEAAFGCAEGVQNGGNVLGQIAVAASESLNPIAGRRFVREAAERLAKMEFADETYSGLSDLAEAQARLGDFAGAKRSATAIGVGPTRFRYDMTDGQPYALIRVASVQREAGDIAGANETLRDAFRSVRDHPTMSEREGRFSQIARGQIANGDIDGALQSVSAMEEVPSQVLAYIARAQAASGAHADAQATFARALGDAGRSAFDPPAPKPALVKPPGVSPKMSLEERRNLAEIQAMAGDIAGALKTLQSDGDEFYRRYALQMVVSARATAGNVADALRLCLDESKTPAERRAALEGLGHGVDTRLSLKSLEPRVR
jgi:RNA polymerase sigma factor (sigma-70 family)